MVCQLLGDAMSLLIQGLLGVSALGTLVVKRVLEVPKRQFRVFVYDVSKQAIGQLYAHGLNLLIAIRLTQPEGDQCIWYFVNFIVDVVCGLPLTYGLVWVTNRLAYRYHWTSLLSGEYVQDNSCVNRSYLKQIGVWLLVVTLTKLLLLGLVLVPAQGGLLQLGTTMLRPVTRHDNETLELIVVMVLVPLSLNIVQYWVQDAFLKGKDTMVARGDYASSYSNLEKPTSNLKLTPANHVNQEVINL